MSARRKFALMIAFAALAATVGAGTGCSDSPAVSSTASETTSSSTPPVVTRTPKPSPSPSPTAAASSRSRILDIDLPTDVTAVTARLGKPDAVQLPGGDDPSSWGQWFRWEQQDKSAVFAALGDDYSPDTPDFGATVRFIELRAKAGGGAKETIHGFTLNRTFRAEVEKALGGVLQPSVLYKRTELASDGLYRDALKYERDRLFTYFFFGVEGRLVGVAQATFDVEGAD